MDLQTRKIKVIQEFLMIDNEDSVARFEELLKKECAPSFTPMSMADLEKRINQSMEDSEKERLTEAGDLITEIQGWH